MSAKLTGFKELHDWLTNLPAELAASVGTGALRAGAEVIAAEARRLAPVTKPTKKNRTKYGLYAGALRDSIRVTDGYVKNGIAHVSILAGEGAGKGPKFKTYYAKMVEFGTAPHWISVKVDARPVRNTRRGPKPYSIRTLNKMAKTGSLKIGENFVGESVHHPGARPRPFMRPAFDTMQQAAQQAVADYLAKKMKRIGRAQPAMRQAA